MRIAWIKYTRFSHSTQQVFTCLKTDQGKHFAAPIPLYLFDYSVQWQQMYYRHALVTIIKELTHTIVLKTGGAGSSKLEQIQVLHLVYIIFQNTPNLNLISTITPPCADLSFCWVGSGRRGLSGAWHMLHPMNGDLY